MTLNLEHQVSDCRMQAMLIPFGLYRNAYAAELKRGDEIITNDEPKCHLQVVAVSVIPVRSPITDAISMLIYGVPIEALFDEMLKRNGSSIFSNKLIFIVYEHTYTEPMR
jgi:hypothetical protein